MLSDLTWVKIEKLSNQLEKSYQKVQDIAMKSIDGSGNTKLLNSIEKLLEDRDTFS